MRKTIEFIKEGAERSELLDLVITDDPSPVAGQQIITKKLGLVTVKYTIIDYTEIQEPLEQQGFIKVVAFI